MSCLTAGAHINIIPLCPPGLMTQDTVHLISRQQMAGSLIVPIPHRRQLQAGAVISTPDNRWDEEVWLVWSQGGGGQKA